MTERTIPQLGNVVRDITTGFTGIATQYIEMMSGTVQLAVQPQLPEGTTFTAGEAIPPALSIDLAQLDHVTDGIAYRVIPAGPETIALGNEVEEIVSGLRGIAIQRATFLNGCVYYSVQPRPTEKMKKDGMFSEPSFIASQRLKIIGQGVAAQMAPATAEPAEKRPGGPTTRAMRP